MTRLLSLLTLVALAVAVPAAANDYKAERFDARVEVLQGGSLRVTETIVFRFEEGTFKNVERVIPTRRTDGVEFVSASMDAVPFTRGTGVGHVNVRRKDGGLRVEWAFSPEGPSVHTFVLSYVARGVVLSENGTDVVAWRALPSEHKYAIDESRVELLLPAAPLGLPRVQTRRVGSVSPSSEQGQIIVEARNVERNGWIEVTARMAEGSVIATPPEWQRRQQTWARYRQPALLAGALLLFAGAVLLFGLRQSYDTPPPDVPVATAFSGPPDDLPPGLAGALAANGTPRSPHAFATLFWLAQRGVISVQEDRGVWGTRSFRLRRERAPHTLAPHEQALLDTVFRGAAGDDGVTMSKAHSHVTMRFSKFREAVRGELAAAGLIDRGRQQVRSTYNAAGVALLALGLVACAPVAALVPRYSPWFFLVPSALLVVAIASFIGAAAHTPLSNEGVRRAAAWRAFKKFLKELPREDRQHASPAATDSPTVLLPYAVALGVGMYWAKLFKQRNLELPAWFRAASAVDAHRSFSAFVGTTAATGHGGGGVGGGGGGGAAGGGSSGAS